MEPLSARTLPDLVCSGAEHHRDREAIVDGPVRLTYAGLAEEVARFAGALAARGVGKGDRVALWAPNSWRWVVAALGVVTAGGVLVPLNTRFKGPEAGYILARSGARLLLVDDGFLGNRYVDSLAAENLPDLSDIVTLAEWDTFSLRVAVTGATTVPVVMIERLREELKLARVLTAYGLTESCGTATMCRPGDDPTTVSTTCGAAIDGVEVAVDPVTSEVLIRGYNVMRGYWQDPAATADALDAAGWLHTGDIGVLDERGYLRITDRLKDMFIVGGFNAYPAEIEQVLARHEGVAEVAVIGVPDERLGEVARACIVPRTDHTVTHEELAVYCMERLANYTLPRSYVFLDALPRNASGKVLKTTLRAAA
ncbi:AMP-binding protein [Dactylosporangium sp. CA-152071]|uniref:AMP-binding protein n=1 Tax=Dactylosporangium sp. CA-152071 TaxID=3239933 RepID=UPI003D9310BB